MLYNQRPLAAKKGMRPLSAHREDGGTTRSGQKSQYTGRSRADIWSPYMGITGSGETYASGPKYCTMEKARQVHSRTSIRVSDARSGRTPTR